MSWGRLRDNEMCSAPANSSIFDVWRSPLGLHRRHRHLRWLPNIMRYECGPWGPFKIWLYFNWLRAIISNSLSLESGREHHIEMKEFYNRPKLLNVSFSLRVSGPQGPSKTEMQFLYADFAKFSSREEKREKKNKTPNSYVCCIEK